MTGNNFKFDNENLYITRSGYTGEDGFEISIPNNKVEKLISFLKENKVKAVGWMQGRMEFGPRALGNRSIIADPRSEVMQRQLNIKVKYRESLDHLLPAY